MRRLVLSCLVLLALALSAPHVLAQQPQPAAKSAPATLVNLNTATQAQLEELPGIGAKMAERIIEYRQKSPFKKVEDLMNVQGIGEKNFLRLKNLITVAPAKADKPGGVEK
jgi:competence protein ComEA